jgi:D-amino-acid dehydrogenase
VRVIVIGGGAVGVCAAEALASRGAEVTMLERDHCGAGASAGNAGWITPSLATPIPGPGVIVESLRWLLNADGPLWIRPTLSPAMLTWIAMFTGRCTARAFDRGLTALQAIADHAGAAFDRLAQRGIQFEMHSAPLLYPSFEHGELDTLCALATKLQAIGAPALLEPISAAELGRLEPALGDGLIGGMIARGDRRVRPERFVASVCRALASLGVEVRERSQVTGLMRDRDHWRVQTATGEHVAEAVVIASGVETERLLTPLGIRLPLAAAKGYSRTYPVDPTAPRSAIYLEGPKVAISAFDEGTRVSGTLELGARNLSLSPRRLSAISAAAQRALPSWRPPAQPQDWAGFRSLSPDGLPYLGSVPGHDGLLVATGHGTLGITLAPIGGELLADLLLERRSSPLLEPFKPDRRVATDRLARLARAGARGYRREAGRSIRER